MSLKFMTWAACSTSAQFHDRLGKSKAMQAVYQQIRDVARVDSTVLIEGETGTGKELVARAIHFSGHRKDKPFGAVNCAGLTESLLGSQLFLLTNTLSAESVVKVALIPPWRGSN
jgi:transcriptional regulator with GAF, ATPase, and Fis domain